jgi:hypothetical protein
MRTLRATSHQLAAGANSTFQTGSQPYLPQGTESQHVGIVPAERNELLARSAGAHGGEVFSNGGQTGLLAGPQLKTATLPALLSHGSEQALSAHHSLGDYFRKASL